MTRTSYKLTGAALLCLGFLHAGLAQDQTTPAAPTTVHLVSKIDVKVLFSKDAKGHHQDAAWICRASSKPRFSLSIESELSKRSDL